MRVHSSIFFALLLSTQAPAQAQSLFKCGAVFQDKPCDTEVQKKFSTLTGSFSKEQVNTTADTQCSELGARAVPIIEAKTQRRPVETLLAEIDVKPVGRLEKLADKQFIADVYARNGSPAAVRGAIESACMEKKQALRIRPMATAGTPYPGQTDSGNTRVYAAEARASSAAARAAAAAARAAKY